MKWYDILNKVNPINKSTSSTEKKKVDEISKSNKLLTDDFYITYILTNLQNDDEINKIYDIEIYKDINHLLIKKSSNTVMIIKPKDDKSIEVVYNNKSMIMKKDDAFPKIKDLLLMK